MRRRALLALLAALAALLPAAEAARATLRAPRPGQPPLVLQATSEAEHWRILVLEGGVESQTILVATDLPQRTPRIADADGDGAGDLWVPVTGDNANTAWDLWIMQPGTARFRRAGEVSGLAFARDRAGRLVALSRDGCCTASAVFHAIGPDGALTELFSVERRLDVAGAGRCTGQDISVPPPPSVVRAVCALPVGEIPGRRLAVP